MICTLLFFGIYGVYKPLQEQSDIQVSKNFDTYLSSALARNTPPKKSYRVVFYREDFIDGSIENLNTLDGNNNINSSLSFGDTNISGTQIFVGQEDIIASTRGNFGTPEIIINPNGTVNPDCHGLFYDPCIVLRDYNNPPGEMYLGTTRIYGNPNEI